MLAFPTRPARATKAGYPVRAHHCHCLHGPLIVRGDDTCLLCGHHTRATITRTWTMRARTVAGRSKSRAAA
jgi:hypothetical protein